MFSVTAVVWLIFLSADVAFNDRLVTPWGVSGETVTVRVDLTSLYSLTKTGLGLKATFTPLGADTIVRVTAPRKPSWETSWTVNVAGHPAATGSALGVITM